MSRGINQLTIFPTGAPFGMNERLSREGVLSPLLSFSMVLMTPFV